MLDNFYSEKKTHIAPADLAKILAAHERYAGGRGGARAVLKCANLDGCNLANRNLQEADLTGASLVGANLYGTSLVRASLYCCDLRQCNLRNAKLDGADLRGASFKGADLAFASLDRADLRAAMMMYVGADGVSVVDRTGKNAFGGVDFSCASLRGASFGHAKLEGADFSGALLIGVNFRGATLKEARFDGAVLTGVNLDELKVPRESLARCITDVSAQSKSTAAALKARLDRHQQWIASAGQEGAPAVLDGEDLRALHDWFAGRPLIGLSARNVVAIGLDFSGSQLQGAKFDGADLRGADFSAADLSGVSFRQAKLSHARFDRARLCNLHLHSGEMVAPSLLGAEATEEQFAKAVLEESLAVLGLRSALARGSAEAGPG